MRKQSLIHMHELLVLVDDHIDEDVAYSRYEGCVPPVAIHRSKADHQEAVLSLIEDITDAIE